MKYSHVFQMAYIKNNNLLTFNGLKGIIPEPEIVKVLNYLSELPGEKDFIYNNYCMEGTQDKKHQ